MAISIFKSFRSTVTPFLPRNWSTSLRLLVDPTTGAPAGILNPNDSGADGIWTPIDLTAAQLAAPTAEMIADLNAVYRLNVAPFTRYVSNGTDVVAQAGSSIQGPNGLFGTLLVWWADQTGARTCHPNTPAFPSLATVRNHRPPLIW